MTAHELKKRRTSKFRTQQEAADYYEISKSLMEKYERGARPIRKIHALAFDATLPRGRRSRSGAGWG